MVADRYWRVVVIIRFLFTGFVFVLLLLLFVLPLILVLLSILLVLLLEESEFEELGSVGLGGRGGGDFAEMDPEAARV